MIEPFIIAAVCFIVYWKTFAFGLIVDDDLLRSQQEKGRMRLTRKNILPWLVSRLYGGGTFGHNTRIDHIFTTALHALTCVLIYYAFGASQVSLVAALLYAVNPANNQTAIWLNGRRYQVVVILALLAMLAGPWGFGLYFLSLFFQYTGAFSPLLAGWYGWIWIAVAALAGWPSVLRFIWKRRAGIVNRDMLEYDDSRMIIVVKTFGFLVQKMFIPGRTMMIYPFLIGWGLNEKGNHESYALDRNFWTGMVCIGAAVIGLALLDGKDVLYLCFLILATLQCSNIMVANQNAADRYVSLPNVVAMYFVARLAFAFPAYTWPIAAAIGVYYWSNLQVTMMMYKDLETYYDYHNFFNPENHIPRRYLIYRYLQTGKAVDAFPLIERALRSNESDFTILLQAAKCLQMLGDYKASNFYLIKAEQNQYMGQAGMNDQNIKSIRDYNVKMIEREK